ncbi:CocE/NonD family hydrolase [Hymenobacter convexus]|uniref:CocE/NonD family hydrolase n=1 Tax=Hymenobacter sp. CA1UV-4 TaxID=3063782 RepID=UPI002712AE1F|nr:CocE/NonD family hydrolase [Hymenobacter sp. CA1UV-4]MDO7851325.1 CocE/NonD family hydrolase [Hymenobacter sp. CA1UV-4]
MLRSYFAPAFLLVICAASAPAARAQTRVQDSTFVRQNYTKLDRQIPMRDGTKLYTTIYVPKDASAATPYPFLMTRTPYSAGPYGEQKYRLRGPGPSRELSQEKYIFVYQDVRGRYMSEGKFEEMTPAGTTYPDKQAVFKSAISESSDTYDTIEWLLKNVAGNNGRVGMVGISYPGFYASAALPNAHPALKAVSPQAPVTDEFIGDDARHKGAFFLLDNFEFTNYFDVPRPKPVAEYQPLFKFEPTDSYKFFLELGPIKNANGPKYFNNRARIWNEYQEHETYDAYWQARNIRPALTGVKPAVLVVGGWFDAEDLFGALNTYKAIEKQNPGATNRLVMGPWTHGAWARPDWSKFGSLSFGSNTAETFRQTLETPFFNFYLKDKGSFNPAEATVFNTGTNEWKMYPAWPPAPSETRTLLIQENGHLAVVGPAVETKVSKALRDSNNPHITRLPTVNKLVPPSQYLSDPANPVPYTDGVRGGRNNEYMIEDQRFAAKRPDVLSFRTETLPNDLTVAGPINADLWVSTSGTDADFIVKVIDELPDGTQRLVRAEVMRGRFRNSFSKPEAFKPNQPAEVKYELPDVLHTFQKGHRLMVQVQSTWFPLVDRNPQTFVPIAQAEAKDFQKATIRLYHDAAHPSAVQVSVLP